MLYCASCFVAVAWNQTISEVCLDCYTSCLIGVEEMWMLKWANSQVGREVDPPCPLKYSLQPSSVLRESWAHSRAGGCISSFSAPTWEGLWQPLPQVARAVTECCQLQPPTPFQPLPLPASPTSGTALCLYHSPFGNCLAPEALSSQCVEEPRTLPKEDEEQDKAELWNWKESRVADSDIFRALCGAFC